MIQGYRMAGPPPHGEPPKNPPDGERRWPPWLGFAGLAAYFVIVFPLQIVILVAFGSSNSDDLPEGGTLIVQAVGGLSFVLAAVGCAALVKPVHAWQFGLRPARFWPSVGWIIGALGIFWALLIVYSLLVTTPDQTTAEDLGADKSQFSLLAVGFLVVVVAPIAEEIFFRGLLYGALRSRLAVVPAALIAGTVFGALHAGTGVDAVPPLILLGVILCLLYEKTGSLYPCIALHALNNTFAYISATDVQPGVAAAFGGVMLAGCVVLPRIAWRRGPAAA